MGAIDELASPVAEASGVWSQIRHQSRIRHGESRDGTYGGAVPTSASRSPRVHAFAGFVKRALDEAQERGMSVAEIESETGVPRSTFYRWSRAEIANPDRDKIRQFVDGLGIPRSAVAAYESFEDGRQPVEPEPTVDPDLRAVMRRLNDPNVSSEEKVTIRKMLRYLARGQ